MVRNQVDKNQPDPETSDSATDNVQRIEQVRESRAMMIPLRPRSILQLTITGFLLVTVLLVAAVLIMANQLEDLGARSQFAVSRTTEAMRGGRELIEKIMTMERNARQYTILIDEDLLTVYATRRNELIDSAKKLDALNINRDVDGFIRKLLAEEQAAFDVLSSVPLDEEADVVARYPQMLDTAYQLSYAIDSWIDDQQGELHEHTNRTQGLLKIQAIILVCIALLLTGLFTVLITRPLRQLERVINRLGGGNYDDSVQIRGPRDLHELGKSLDWLRNRLGELEQQRTFFMRHVSHELKTPLTAIHEGIALLDDGLVGSLSEQQNDVIRILRNNCHRLQKQIEDLLRYNVDSLSVLKPMPHPVRLDKVLNRVISDHELVVKTQQLRIVRNFEKVLVYGDKEQIRVIVDNLLSNAVKYSPVNGSINIRILRRHEHVLLDIYDEGPGIPQDERTRIFEAFYQGQSPGRLNVHGTGLGLAITREYVRLNNGTIEVLDTEMGAGFRITVPLYSTEKR